MASIEQIVKENTSFSDMVAVFKKHPEFIPEVFRPLYDAGFNDFKLVASGTSSLLVASTDNDNIVFRVTNESAPRRDDIPFSLCSAYENYNQFKGHDEIRLEMLLAGKEVISEKDKAFLLDEMRLAGWQRDKIRNVENFWKDVVMVSVRDSAGRVKTAPIISDPSAFFNYLEDAEPAVREVGDGSLEYPNLNRCSSNYITLQDQAAAYNAAIENDERLKRLIDKPITFDPTEVIPVHSAPLPPRS